MIINLIQTGLSHNGVVAQSQIVAHPSPASVCSRGINVPTAAKAWRMHDNSVSISSGITGGNTVGFNTTTASVIDAKAFGRTSGFGYGTTGNVLIGKVFSENQLNAGTVAGAITPNMKATAVKAEKPGVKAVKQNRQDTTATVVERLGGLCGKPPRLRD